MPRGSAARNDVTPHPTSLRAALAARQSRNRGSGRPVAASGRQTKSPCEVAGALYAHSAVYEAGVVGVPDAELGEPVRAYVALKAGRDAAEAELISRCGYRLAAYKTPKSVVFADQLPKGPTGKVLRRSLRLRAYEAVG